MLNLFDARLDQIEYRFGVKGTNQNWCNCGNDDIRRIIWGKLMQPGDPDNGEEIPEYVKPPCSLEAIGETCNPRPESKIRKLSAAERKSINQQITKKLMGDDDWPERVNENFAFEAGPDAMPNFSGKVDDQGRTVEREQLHREPEPPETSGDPIYDQVLARLKLTGELSREQLAAKLLVKLPADDE